MAGRPQGLIPCFFEIASRKKPRLESNRGFRISPKGFYFTLAKMMTSVYSASDSISANPRISAS